VALNVSINQKSESINISNSLGQKVYIAKLLTEKTYLDISKFGKQGFYFVQIMDEKGMVIGSKKVVLL